VKVNSWRVVRIAYSRCAHLFVEREGRWISRCHHVKIQSLSETQPIDVRYAKCKRCVPFEIRRKVRLNYYFIYPRVNR